MTDLDRLKEVVYNLKKTGIIKKQEDIALKTGYNKSSISEILNGKSQLSEKFVRVFCSEFDIDFNSILLESTEMNNYKSNNSKVMKDDLERRINDLENQIKLFLELIKSKDGQMNEKEERIKDLKEMIEMLKEEKEILKQRNACYSLVEEQLKVNS